MRRLKVRLRETQYSNGNKIVDSLVASVMIQIFEPLLCVYADRPRQPSNRRRDLGVAATRYQTSPNSVMFLSVANGCQGRVDFHQRDVEAFDPARQRQASAADTRAEIDRLLAGL